LIAYEVVKPVAYRYKDTWGYKRAPVLKVGTKLYINDFDLIGCVVSFSVTGTVYKDADCPYSGISDSYKGAFKKITSHETVEQWYQLPCTGKGQPTTAWFESEQLDINPGRCND
jgi:hypothetical protein